MAGVVFATGMDNVALYVPLFALIGLARASGAALGYILVFAVVTCAIAYAAPNVAHLWRFRRYVDAALGVFFIFVGYSIFTHGLS
jgi:cadmium resistance protein CadD (predicted permease)